MSKVVFISHSSKEHDRAEEICNVLENNGISCWIAPRDIIGGMPYAEEIVKAIRECKIILLIASVSINMSEQIMNEVEMAVNHSKIILPFKIDSVEYNDSYKYYLSRKHWIEAVPDPKDFYSLLVEEIKYLISNENVNSDTINDTYLAALKERNRQNLISKTQDKRLSFGLSIKTDDYADKHHFYQSVKRYDLLEQTGRYFSYRWLEIKNVSDKTTHHIVHKECGENKVYFDAMRIKAKQILPEGDQKLVVDSITEIQPNFIQVFKIHFAKPLKPGETAKIYYRLDWPGEGNSYYTGELSQSISLTRYVKGTGRLTFGILRDTPLYDFELYGVNKNFESLEPMDCTPHLLSADDDPGLKQIHGKNFTGAYYVIEDAGNMSAFRIFYKQAADGSADDDDEDF